MFESYKEAEKLTNLIDKNYDENNFIDKPLMALNYLRTIRTHIELIESVLINSNKEKEFKKKEKSELYENYCLHPDHNFPMFLYIAPGKNYTHTCPGCGNKMTVSNSIMY